MLERLRALIPIAQIPFAATTAVILRTNLPAVAATLYESITRQHQSKGIFP